MRHLIGKDALRILGIVLFIVGFIILYIIGRRKFTDAATATAVSKSIYHLYFL